ncbi:ABC transporter substrate-binding protein [Streptomyces althioticus]|uniref:ABC transporter substrate-binding protein n=2 Tax=Streptomyces althioticus TaxID=83380 RepID=A0ABZ1XZZ8_9ACTN|nr:ABC transporter substrate-binding protein [Streptomyces sp. DSM 41972]WTB51092.1 ABC transporter substrate-binding protein [Streptomyces althioticus]SCD55970.1 NitT/TauT family transport system substrate-binding protein [Streptomyces sp. di50b]SCE39931.1 NitT/TauT family transport system substrate-binding protein [Streptomyces sp. di188]GGQ91413.1 lipoprotein [Streptomyces griseorubens]
MRQVRRLGAALVGLALCAALGACGYGSQRVGTTAKVMPTGAALSASEVRVGYFPNLTHATALVGVREGMIQKKLGGTKLSTATFNAGPTAIEALHAGSVDLAWVGPSPAVNGYTRLGGKGLRIVAGAASGGVKLVVDPEKIRTPAEVKGKRIASPQLGNTQDVALLHWIAEQGWKVDPLSGRGDVSVVRTDTKMTPNAYTSGSIDGAWVPEPTASLLVAQGARVLVEEADLWPDRRFVTTHLIVSQRFLDRHPDVVDAVVAGAVAANAWIAAEPERARRSVNEALRELTGKPLPAGIIESAWPSLTFTDDPLAATLEAQAAHATAAGLLDRPVLRGIYDLGPLNRVRKAAGLPPADDAGLGTP